jgi:two-component system sensor histidine kinase AlgZ
MMHKQTHDAKNPGLIPDYCNIGILFRALIIINAIVFLALLSRGGHWLSTMMAFIEASAFVEVICFFSLFSLCGIRHLKVSHTLSPWLQRVSCGLVPALFCSILLTYLSTTPWLLLNFPGLDSGYTIFLCFLLGMLLQHYFELRNQAFSPALSEARLQVLQARIRPHFLFNSLNTVLSLIRTEPRRAETVLENLADLFRVLMRDTRDMTTLQEELDLCEKYLAIEKVRLGERLQVSWQIENLTQKELQDTQMAALLLQPLLENAVHYGVEPSAAPALIMVQLRRSAGKIIITVNNPTHPDARLSQGNQMALENIRQRLYLLYDLEAQLSFSLTGNNFEVSLYFPCQHV